MSWDSTVIALLKASLVRPFAVAAVAWVMLRVFRVRHPASRHAVWTGVLFGMVLLPFLSVLGPHWNVPVLPAVPVAERSEIAPAPVVGSLAFEYADAGQKTGGRAEALTPRPSGKGLVIWLYLAGVVAMAGYRVAGLVLLRRVISGSRRLRGRFLLESDDVLTPVAVGVLRPAVILPAGWRLWSATARRAVLAHEMAHVRRDDSV